MMKYTEEKQRSIVEDYKKGMSWSDLCSKYSTNLNTLHKIFNKYCVRRHRIEQSSWSKEKIDLFIEMYTRNCTYNEMYEALDCKGGTLTYWVHKLGLPMRGSGRNNTAPNKFLIRTPESDYWLGYIFADGHIGCYKYNYSITLASEYEHVVLKFKQWYDNIPFIHTSKYVLKDGTVKTMYKACLSSKDIALWFRDILNIDNKKHHTLNPNINITWDILRGFFDGDGCSSKGKFVIKSCSTVWLERVQKFLASNNIVSTISRSYLDCYCLAVYRKEELQKLVSLLYKNKYYCHEYKYKNFEPYISNDVMKTE